MWWGWEMREDPFTYTKYKKKLIQKQTRLETPLQNLKLQTFIIPAEIYKVQNLQKNGCTKFLLKIHIIPLG